MTLPGTEWTAIVEVRGYKGGASVNDLLRIQRFATRYAVDEGKAPDACWYVVNQLMGRDPAERRPPLASNPEELRSFGDGGGVVADTTEIFQLACAFEASGTSARDGPKSSCRLSRNVRRANDVSQPMILKSFTARRPRGSFGLRRRRYRTRLLSNALRRSAVRRRIAACPSASAARNLAVATSALRTAEKRIARDVADSNDAVGRSPGQARAGDQGPVRIGTLADVASCCRLTAAGLFAGRPGATIARTVGRNAFRCTSLTSITTSARCWSA